jgi:hypothetical protein
MIVSYVILHLFRKAPLARLGPMRCDGVDRNETSDIISAHPAEKPTRARKERNPTNGTQHQQQQ